ncbi:transglycosylase SLT domain-containing protein [Thermomonas sp.]|uniref:transglycosylase SLT domain-containing protein n=1 Tax=Thermomonas sp. TaxID=1971895 RepID=UPI002C580A96|nr:transglycosylase SLT domain-containing protein [Thermomonas sp.]HRO63014.1 transglycosylase SLT domain-containing protein [Thermomonas sp.]
MMTPRIYCASLLLSLPLLAALVPSTAHALSRRDEAAVAALQQRMDAAEKHYRDAKTMEDEDAGAKAAQQALAEMQVVVADCAKLKACNVAAMLEAYERLLKANAEADAEATGEGEFEDDPIDASELAGTDVPDQASANVLLSEEGRRFVRMVQFNPAVQAGIRRWLTDMRPSLMDSYENYRYMQHLMSPSFKRRGLPEALLFGIMAKESNGKVHVGSRAGAVGPLQFMPATGRRFGLGDDGSGFDTRYDPRASADAAAEYLSERMAQLNNSIELSLAGYNGGEGRALRVFQATGGRSFWNADVYNQFPAETKDYVPMVIAAAWLFLHPKDYGIRWPRVSVRPTTLQLSRPASLYELTICLGNYGSRDGYLRALRNLNPRWAPATTLPAGTTLNATTRIAWLYSLHCRGGRRVELARELVASDVNAAIVQVGAPVPVSGQATDAASSPAAAPAAPARPKTYRVKRGDSVHAIANKFRCNLAALARANRLKAPRYTIRPGQTLLLKGCEG